MLVDQGLDVVLDSGEEFVELEDLQDGAEGAEVEDEIRVGDREGVKARGEGVLVSAGLELEVMWGRGYVGNERLEAAGFWTREREGLVKGMLGKEETVLN